MDATYSSIQEWWTTTARYFFSAYILPYENDAHCFGTTRYIYAGADEFYKLQEKACECFDGYKQIEPFEELPVEASPEESKGSTTTAVVIDDGPAWYDVDSDTGTCPNANATWTPNDNNIALYALRSYYLTKNLFCFVEIKRSKWAVLTQLEPSDVPYESYRHHPDMLSTLTPIEFVQNGWMGPVCGTAFPHLLCREWHVVLHVNNVATQMISSFSVKLRKLQGTFSWFWLAGKLRVNNEDRLVLFSNEPLNKNGHRLYISCKAIPNICNGEEAKEEE